MRSPWRLRTGSGERANKASVYGKDMHTAKRRSAPCQAAEQSRRRDHSVGHNHNASVDAMTLHAPTTPTLGLAASSGQAPTPLENEARSGGVVAGLRARSPRPGPTEDVASGRIAPLGKVGADHGVGQDNQVPRSDTGRLPPLYGKRW